jgi:hypothetical protein
MHQVILWEGIQLRGGLNLSIEAQPYEIKQIKSLVNANKRVMKEIRSRS